MHHTTNNPSRQNWYHAEQFLYSLTGTRSIPHTASSKQLLHPCNRQKYLKKLLSRIGSPQEEIPIIHIGGSGGKGSTALYLDALLRHQGLSTILHTSPHLFSTLERIVIQGKPLESSQFFHYVCELREYLHDLFMDAGGICLTYFEAVLFLLFRAVLDYPCDYLILEVGLGGTYDGTNILKKPSLTILTDIFLEHTTILGNTTEKILSDKLGITRQHVPLLFGSSDPQLQNLAQTYVNAHSIPLWLRDIAFRTSNYTIATDRCFFDYHSQFGHVEQLSLRNPGTQQVRAASLALAACEVLMHNNTSINVSELSNGSHAKQAWLDFILPGRLERITQRIFLDVAHSRLKLKPSLEYLAATDQISVIFLVGFLQDTNWRDFLLECISYGTEIIVSCPYPSVRTIQNPMDVVQWIRKTKPEVSVQLTYDMLTGYQLLHQSLQKNQTSIGYITGSFYFVGPLRSYLLESGGEIGYP
jgi:dihydrofolate synthase / folylpolyglutamate synthase